MGKGAKGREIPSQRYYYSLLAMPRDHTLSCSTHLLAYILHIIPHSLSLTLTVSSPLTPARIHINQPRHVVWLSWVNIRCLICLLESNLIALFRIPNSSYMLPTCIGWLFPLPFLHQSASGSRQFPSSSPCFVYLILFVLYCIPIFATASYQWGLLCVLW